MSKCWSWCYRIIIRQGIILKLIQNYIFIVHPHCFWKHTEGCIVYYKYKHHCDSGSLDCLLPFLTPPYQRQFDKKRDILGSLLLTGMSIARIYISWASTCGALTGRFVNPTAPSLRRLFFENLSLLIIFYHWWSWFWPRKSAQEHILYSDIKRL